MSTEVASEITLPVLPLKNTVVYPVVTAPLAAGRPASVAAIEAAAGTEDKLIAVFAQRDPSIEVPTVEDLYPVGTLCVIRRLQRQDQGMQMLVQGRERIELLEATSQSPYLQVRARRLAQPEDSGPEVDALQRSLLELASRILQLGRAPMEIDLAQLTAELGKPIEQAYVVVSWLSLDVERHQRLLVADTQEAALRLAVDYLGHEAQVLQVQQEISSAVESKLSKEQREAVLRRQMHAIQEELGAESPEQADIAELRRRLEEAEVPETVGKEVDKELTRLERMSSASPDYQITRTWVELALELPWTHTTEDHLDLERARQVLDEDHFDLEDVKERIIEHLAVMKLNPQAAGPILCLVGPPGVGKTSIGQSIARALGRTFERMSLGGLHDEAELRGHRRTYIGAMPGRILRAIRRAGVRNPLLMLDEVDKVGRDFRGDPTAALMEILDPAQNSEFNDNYLDLPFDLSRVFFVATANTLDTIPGPLLDRMEVLRLAGYSDEEKAEIARRYLIDRKIAETGIDAAQLTVPDETLARIIRRYTREAGVRELERVIGRLARKVATRVARGDTAGVTVTAEVLDDFLGPARFLSEGAREHLVPGVVAGLAWTQAGGDVLYVEAVALPESNELMLTGQLGDVMQESAKAARSYIWSQCEQLGIDRERIRQGGVHIHVPAGATPKDGPSAGVTMATALASLYSDCPVREDTAMTGEITLSGLVLPVGGIKEKVLAAHRAGFKQVVLPHDNEKDLRDVPEHVRSALDFVLAARIEDVLAAAVPGMDTPGRPQAAAGAS